MPKQFASPESQQFLTDGVTSMSCQPFVSRKWSESNLGICCCSKEISETLRERERRTCVRFYLFIPGEVIWTHFQGHRIWKINIPVCFPFWMRQLRICFPSLVLLWNGKVVPSTTVCGRHVRSKFVFCFECINWAFAFQVTSHSLLWNSQFCSICISLWKPHFCPWTRRSLQHSVN